MWPIGGLLLLFGGFLFGLLLSRLLLGRLLLSRLLLSRLLLGGFLLLGHSTSSAKKRSVASSVSRAMACPQVDESDSPSQKKPLPP